MPPDATHLAGTLYRYEDRLRIEAGRFSVEHRRRKPGDPPAPLPEHRAAKLAAVHGRRGKLYEKREQLLRLGSGALALLTELTHRDRQLAYASIEELYQLLVRHGDDALRGAIELAVLANRMTVAGVRAHLRASDAGREASAPRGPESQPRGAESSPSKPKADRAARMGGAR